MAKVLFWLVVVIGVVSAVGYLLYATLYFSNVEVTIEGEHDPTKSKVLVGETVLYPSGNEGRLYTAKVRPGTKTVSYQSYNVSLQEEEITFSFDSTEKVIFKTTTISANAKALELIELKSGEKIASANYFFGEDVWLIAKILPESSYDPATFYVYKYSETAGWEQVTFGTKISDIDPLFADAPEGLILYLQTEAGD